MSRGQPLDLCPLEDLDRVAGAQLHDGLLPAGTRALEEAAPLRLRLNLDHVDALDLDVEELLDGLADLRLVRVRMDLERVAPARRRLVRLLADDRREDHLGCVHYEALPVTASRAASVRSSDRAHVQAVTSSSDGETIATFCRLRKL